MPSWYVAEIDRWNNKNKNAQKNKIRRNPHEIRNDYNQISRPFCLYLITDFVQSQWIYLKMSAYKVRIQSASVRLSVN